MVIFWHNFLHSQSLLNKTTGRSAFRKPATKQYSPVMTVFHLGHMQLKKASLNDQALNCDMITSQLTT